MSRSTATAVYEQLLSEGYLVVRKVWNGRANLLELEVDGPAGHIEALSLRLYNPESHQWSLNFSNSSVGVLGTPTVGEFRNVRGEFYDQESLGGRAILVRFVRHQAGLVSLRAVILSRRRQELGSQLDRNRHTLAEFVPSERITLDRIVPAGTREEP